MKAESRARAIEYPPPSLQRERKSQRGARNASTSDPSQRHGPLNSSSHTFEPKRGGMTTHPIHVDDENPFMSSLYKIPVKKDVGSSPSRVLDLRERLAHPMSIGANPFSSSTQPGSTDSSIEDVTAHEPPLSPTPRSSKSRRDVTQNKRLSGVVDPVSGNKSPKLFEDPDPFASYYSRFDRVTSRMKKGRKGNSSDKAAIDKVLKYSVSIKYCDANGKIEDVDVAQNVREQNNTTMLEKNIPCKETIDDPNDISMYFQSGEPSLEKEKWKEDTSWMNASLIGPSSGDALSEQASSKQSSSKQAFRKELQGDKKELPVLRKDTRRQRRKEKMVRAYSRGREKREAKQKQGINRYNPDSNDDDLFEDISKLLLSLGNNELATHAIVLHSLLPSCYLGNNQALSKEYADNMLITMVDSIESLVLDNACGVVDSTFERRTASVSSSSSCSSSAFSFTSASAAASASQNYSIDDRWDEREDNVSRATSTNLEDEKSDTSADIKNGDGMMPVQDDSKSKDNAKSREVNHADITESPWGMGQDDSKGIITDIVDFREDAGQVGQTNAKESIMDGHDRVAFEDDIKDVKQERTKDKANMVITSDSPRGRRQRRNKQVISEIMDRQKVMDNHRHQTPREDSLMFCGIADEIFHDVFKKRASNASRRLATASPPSLEFQNAQESDQETCAASKQGTGRDMKADLMVATENQWMHQLSNDMKWPKKLVFMLQKLRCPATGVPGSLLCQREEYEDREPSNLVE